MGRLKKGHNWKARLSENIEDNQKESETKDQCGEKQPCCEPTEIDTSADSCLSYGNSLTGSNALALPSKKIARKLKAYHVPVVKKKLTKKERKRLEKIVDSKKKKAKRGNVLKLLAESSIKDDEISQYSSSSRLGQVESGMLKRKLTENSQNSYQLQSLVKRGRKKGKRERLQKKMKKMNKESDVKGSETSGNDESDEDEDGVKESGDDKDINEVSENEVSENEVNEKQGRDSHDKTHSPTTKADTWEKEGPVDPNLGANPECPKEEKVTETIDSTKHNCSKESTSYATKSTGRPTYVEINRDTNIQAARLQLPILGEEQVVMEAIKDNEIVLLVGETGSGKTTQVPQFLYEAGYSLHGMIGITEPRRVAAVNMSQRVALEMNMSTTKVSYQIRYEGNTTSETCLKFMTDGVLLREVEKDFLLSGYSVIVIDEAHERSVYTDILIGLLSRIVQLRKKRGNVLKLIIMSATLRVEDFTSNDVLFSPTPPVVRVEARQFPVTVHFNKHTPNDYVNEAFKKVAKIHRTLPEGGILVFLTGQSEIHSLCRKLRKSFPFGVKCSTSSKEEASEKKAGINLDDYSMVSEPVVADREVEDEDVGEPDKGYDTSDSDSESTGTIDKSSPMYVLPLYSLLPNQKQRKVFETPPSGARFCVVATNVAETSLTIPNIKYVVDSGMVKRRFYDKTTGISTFKITWTSKASANQRAGRAGRTGPGHCYRLFSSAVFNNDFEEFTQPDILRRPVDDLVLQMKAINIDKVVNFPFPTPPEANSVEAAEKLLVHLGALALKKNKKGLFTSVITALGRTMTQFPVSPRFAKMLCLGHQNHCLQYVVVIVAALTVHEIFSQSGPQSGDDGKKELQSRITKLRRKWAGGGSSQLLGDFMVMLRAVGAAEFAGCSTKFCHASGVRHKAMIEIRKLRVQLTNAINAVNAEAQLFVDPKMQPPSEVQTKVLRQIILACFGDHVARKMTPEECQDPNMKNAYQCHLTNDPVFIHPTSGLFSILPDYIVFQEVVETTKLYVKGVAAIECDWLATLVPQHCSFSKPLKDPAPRYDERDGVVKCYMNITFGAHVWPLLAQELPYPPTADSYKWFGRFLLEGKVCPELVKFCEHLLGLPSSMVKSWSKLQPRTEALFHELADKDVRDKAGLLTGWKEDNNFLLKSYLQWLPACRHEEVKRMWPPS